MKNADEILARARELVSAEVERRLVIPRLPGQCMYNHRQLLDVRPTVDGTPNDTFNTVSFQHGQTIGLCMLGAQRGEDGTWVVAGSDQEEAKWAGTICEDPIDAQRCPYFSPAVTRDQVLASLAEDLTSLEWVGTNMPELAALLWVLDTEAVPRIPWLQRVLLPFRKVKVEALRPNVDPSHQLLPKFP